MKYSVALILWIAFGLVSCYDDKGNYDYSEIDELTISGMPEEAISALHKAENLMLSPVVTSKYEGEITADNPNYEFAYYYNRTAGGDFLTPSLLDSAKVKDLNILAEIDPGNYTGWFKVTDLRTNIVTSAEFKLEVLTATTKGWLVLCEAEERKVRVDMIGEIGDRTVVLRDVLDFLPESHGAHQLYMESEMVYTGSTPYLNLYTEEGSYRVYSVGGDFSRTSYSDPRAQEFIRKVDDIIVAEGSGYSCMMITSEGDVYHRASGTSGVYDVKINVDEPLTDPTYKIAPFMGYSWSQYAYNGVLYDKTNKAFKYFLAYAYNNPNGLRRLFDPTEPEADAKYFDWKTGKDMVYMAGTNQSNLVFALMKDASGQYSIYGIRVGQYNASPVQSTYIDIDANTASGLANATCYAFHPTLPFLFYSNGSEVYLYDMATRTETRVVTLSGENISMLKFYKLKDATSYSAAVQEYQYRLAVGSAKTGAEAGSEGVLRFYDVPEFAAELAQFGDTYSGFGVIKDIAYKGR